MLDRLRRHWPLILLSVMPAAIVLSRVTPERHAAIFFTVAAILPLAAYMGRATEALAARWGEDWVASSMPRSATPRN